MALGELINSNDTLNQGRIKINNFYSGGTIGILVSGSGAYSVVRTDPNTNMGNVASGLQSFAGGLTNRASGTYSIAFWGKQNSATTTFSSVFTGIRNVSSSQHASILAGYQNTISASSFYSLILNGKKNIIDLNSKYSSIINGKTNLVAGQYNVVFGLSNSAWTNHNSVLGGRFNSITGDGLSDSFDNAILGGGGIGDIGFNNSPGKNYIKQSNKSIIAGGIANNIYASESSIILGSGKYTNSFPGYSLVKLPNTISASTNSSIISSTNSSISTGNLSLIIGGSSINISGARNFSIGSSYSYVQNSNRSSIISSKNSKILNNFYGSIILSPGSTISGKTVASNLFIAGAASSRIISYTSGVSLRNTIIGGATNTILQTGGTLTNTSIFGGLSNKIAITGGTITNTSIFGGESNNINKYGISGTIGNNSIISGLSNKILHNNTGNGNNNIIGGGNLNVINSTVSTLTYNSGIIGGISNSAITNNAFIGGGQSNCITAKNGAIIGGRNNTVAHAYAVALGGGSQTRNTLQLVIGNQPTLASNVANNRIRLDANTGSGVATAGFAAGVADFAEYFEWQDGNPNNENRLGYFVSLIDGKVKIGNSNIIGIVSSAPGFLGDAAELAWGDMYQKDEWNREIFVTYKSYSWLDKNEEEIKVFEDESGRKMVQFPNPGYPLGLDYKGTIPNSASTSSIKAPKMNPNYNPNIEYTPRSERKEWIPIGLIGKLHVRTAEPITSKSIDVNSQGMAINGTKYMVLNKVREHTNTQYGIVRVFFK